MSDETAPEQPTGTTEAPLQADSSTNTIPAPAAPAEDILGGDTAPAQDAPQPSATQAPDLLQTGQQYAFEQPRGVQMDERVHQELSGFAGHLARAGGITEQAQAQALYEAIASHTHQHEQQMRESIRAVQEEHNTALEREVGQAQAQQLRSQANSYLKQNGGEGLAKVLVENGLGRHPEVIKFFAGRAPATEPTTGASAPATPMTMAEAMRGDEATWNAYIARQRT